MVTYVSTAEHIFSTLTLQLRHYKQLYSWLQMKDPSKLASWSFPELLRSELNYLTTFLGLRQDTNDVFWLLVATTPSWIWNQEEARNNIWKKNTWLSFNESHLTRIKGFLNRCTDLFYIKIIGPVKYPWNCQICSSRDASPSHINKLKKVQQPGKLHCLDILRESHCWAKGRV